MSEPTNIKVSSTNSVDVSVVKVTDSTSVAITDGSNANVSINSEAGNKVLATQKSPTLSLSISASDDLGVQTKEKMSVTVINPNEYIYQESTEPVSWGDIIGTVSDQTDLTTYVANNALQDGQEVLDALNEGGLEAITLGKTETPVKVFNISVTDADGLREYSLPLPLDVGDKYGYFLFTDSDGSLGWKPFPLEFLTGQSEEAKVDGGDF